MKIFIILVVSCCVSIPSQIVNADIESDIDFELYKHLDVSPIHTSFDHDVDDFDDDHTTFDSTYDGGGSDIHDDNDNDDNSNQNEDVKKSKKSNENDSNVNGAKKNSADYDNNNDDDDDDHGENNEGNEKDDTVDDDDDDDENDGENDNNDDDEDEEERGDESKIKSTTIKTIDPKGTETVDPDSFHYVSPDDVSHRLSREKRSKKTDKPNVGRDYDFAQSYQDFVQEHFGVDDAKALSANKKQKKKEDDDEIDNGEVEEDEDYEEGAEDGESADDEDSNKSGATSSSPADDYYDDDEDSDDNDDDNDDSSQDDDYETHSGNISNEDEDYKNVKKLSQDTDENPEFCKTVYKNNQECQVCRNPKTKDKSETCSYSSSPSPKRYAYKKEKNYNSNDDYGDPEDDDSEIVKSKKKTKKNKSKKHKSDDFDDDFSNRPTRKKPKSKAKAKAKAKSKKHSKKNKRSKDATDSTLTGGFRPSYPYYYGYQDRRTSTPLQNHYFDNNRNDDLSFKASESQPVTASSETYETDVDIFKGRDWSQCSRKINKEGLTCYYCRDTHGATQEECMYIAGNDDDSSLRIKPKKQNKKVKKFKRNNQSNRKSSIITTTTASSNHITTPITTIKTTSIPKITTTTPQTFDLKNFNLNLKQQQDSNKLNNNLNTLPKTSVSSISWQTNHNYQPSHIQQQRTLNRNQNFANTIAPIPILRQNINTNPLRISVPYGSPSGTDQNIPIKQSDPVKTLEYTEPRNHETLKRMIKVKISNDHDSDKIPTSNFNANNDATVFYSKVLRKF